MKIRVARVQDAVRMVQLLRQLGYERTIAEVSTHIRTSTADPDSNVLVAVAPDGQIAGGLQAIVIRRLAEGDCGEIASLVVDAAWRSMGIGAQLTQTGADWLQARGIGNLRVRCNVKRERAHQFYERFGFRMSKGQKVFDLKLDTNSRSTDST